MIVADPLTEVIAIQPFLPALSTEATPIRPGDRVRQTVLENGLTVLTKPVHTAPVVTVQVWYKIGSRDERPGHNGIAHQLEHMLFQGTTTRPIQYGSLLEALGGEFNAFTGYDQTAYHNTVERNALEAVLTLEADRMKNALIDPELLEKEKGVVISELQGDENNPHYRLNRAVMEAAFPGHPYGRPIGGTKADVETFTVEQVRSYYDRNYRSDNAVLIVVGDFDYESTLQTIRDTFGTLSNPADPPTRKTYGAIESTFVTPKIPGGQTVVLREPGTVPFIQIVYPLPDINHPDIPALSVLDYILDNGGRSSRIYRDVVDAGLGSSAGSLSAHLSAGGWLELWASPVPEGDLDAIDRAFQNAIAKLQRTLVSSEELDRAKTQIRARSILENRDITSQAMQLGLDSTTAGNYRYTETYLDRVDTVTAEDVRQVARTYLKLEYRTVGRFEPVEVSLKKTVADNKMENAELTVAPGHTAGHVRTAHPTEPDTIARYLPAIEPPAAHTVKPPESFTLPNGLRVLLLPDDHTPSVSIRGLIRAGDEFDPEGKEGLATLTAENLMSGTHSYDGRSLARRLENRGASLEFSTMAEGVSISGVALARDWPVVLGTLADVLQNPTFPEDWLELTRQQQVSELLEDKHDPAYVTHRALQQRLYPKDHPLHRYPTEKTLKSIRRADLEQFHRTYYRPEDTVLSVVGDFDAEVMRSQLRKRFGNWRGNPDPIENSLPSVSPPKKFVWLKREIPGLVESVTAMGYPSIDRRDPRYYAALVLNQILGGSTLSSRLGVELRDRLGLTYGVYSWFDAALRWGSFTIQMQTAPENARQAIDTTLSLLEDVRERGVTTEEVETAKRSLVGSDRVALGDPDILAGVILWNQVYGFPPPELNDFHHKIEAVTPAEVNRVARELLHPDRIVVVTTKPRVMLGL
ncbi:MAG: M16 family metallopeptidase [Limnospira sp.]